MIVIAATTPASNQVVITPVPDFRLGVAESLPAGLKRLTTNELESAASRFYDGEEAFPNAIHEARKSTKRVRSVLRMIRPEIHKKVFRFEDDAMRDTARMIAPVRDSISMVESVELLERIYGHLLAPNVLNEIRDNLELQRTRTETRAMEDPQLVLTVVERFEQAHGRYSNWPVDPSARSIYGGGVRNDFAAVGPGVKRTYSHGRARMVEAYAQQTPEKFHHWRKSVRYLRHQMEILTPLWPEVVVGMAITLDRVGEMLGQDHDLAMLSQAMRHDDRLCPDPALRSLVVALANQRRSDLQTAARILGRRVFVEQPSSLTSRLEAYWESRDPGSVAAINAVQI